MPHLSKTPRNKCITKHIIYSLGNRDQCVLYSIQIKPVTSQNWQIISCFTRKTTYQDKYKKNSECFQSLELTIDVFHDLWDLSARVNKFTMGYKTIALVKLNSSLQNVFKNFLGAREGVGGIKWSYKEAKLVQVPFLLRV